MIPWLQAVPGMLDFVIVLDSVFVCVFPSMFMIRCGFKFHDHVGGTLLGIWSDFL